jgi:hypothetical protein
MGFSNQERINMNSKALAAAVIDANPVAQWYETRNPFSFLVDGNRVLTEFSSVPVAANLAAAQSNATANPSLIQDKSQLASAIRLTAVAGTNNSTYIAYSTYNDTSSAVLDNWIQPQLLPQTSGAPSIGYAIVLYDGDPNAGGTEVTTTDGTTGTGQNKSVGWIWQYSSGILLLSDDFKSSVSDPYVLGFRYIGATASSAASTASKLETNFVADETIASGELVRLVTSADIGLTPGRVVKAISSSYANAEVIGVASSGGSQGDSITVITSGEGAVKFGSAPAASLNGQKVYLDSTSGQASTTAPAYPANALVLLGRLTGADGSSPTPNCSLRIQEPIAS